MSDLHSLETKDLVVGLFIDVVPTHGWTLAALRLAVLNAGYKEGDEYRIFSGNVEKVFEHYLDWIDRQMLLRLKDVDLMSMRIKDRIATAVMVRLRLLDKNKEAVKISVAFAKHPTRASLSLRALMKTVSEIWYAAGDTSTDFNYYTKRGLLAGVYSSTLLYWLDDTSEDAIKTRAHLNRRLDQVMQIPKIKARLKDGLDLLKKKFQGS